MSQVELKPCPFCGGEASLSTVGRSWYRITADHEGFCILEEHESDCPQTDDQLALLVRDWNLRTNSEVDQLKAENEALAYLLKRFVNGEHDQDEDQNERHDYHGEAESLLMRIGGEFREYSLVPNEALFAQYEQMNVMRKDAERFRWTNTEGNWVARMFGKWRAHIGEYGDASPTDWYPSREEAIDAAMSKEP